MNNIIQQICENYINEVLNFFGTDKIISLEEMETELKKKTDLLSKKYDENLSRRSG